MAISPRALDLVRDSLPTVAGAIDRITPLFYRNMFAAHPELEDHLFNRGNQKQGEQQKALAGAVAAYASLRTGPDAERADAVLARIAHKHASLGITADQYPIVHRYLFGAIADTLGSALTEQVLAAWDELYWEMAERLIAAENRLYAAAGVEPGDVWRDAVVERRIQQSPDTVSFVLRSADGDGLPPHRPGQYISVQTTLPDGARQIRQYSLVGPPSRREWTISVKSVGRSILPDGTAAAEGEVSNSLFRNTFEGDRLRVSAPFGELVLEDGESPVMLVSAGIGCTPIIGMLHHLADTAATRPVTVVHADRSPLDHAHRAELSDLVGRIGSASLVRWYEDLGMRRPAPAVHDGRADLAQIDVADGTTVYMCGPMPFMRAMRSSLLARNVPEDAIRYEVFGPDAWAPTA